MTGMKFLTVTLLSYLVLVFVGYAMWVYMAKRLPPLRTMVVFPALPLLVIFRKFLSTQQEDWVLRRLQPPPKKDLRRR